jgi:hypothetical protein
MLCYIAIFGAKRVTHHIYVEIIQIFRALYTFSRRQ